MDIVQHLKPLIDWLHIHPGWTGFVTFLISLTESLAVVGYFVPGSVMMTAIGTLIGAGIIPTWSTIIWAIAGAVAGDGLSYRIGYRYKHHIREMWPFKKYAYWMDKGEDFFHQHGGKSVFLGRFVGAVRPMVPMIAGMLDMSPLRFFLSNFFSALLWAPAYMLPGILIGAATLELDPKTATELVLWVLVIVAVIALSFWLLKRMVYSLINKIHLRLDKFWAFLLSHPNCRSLCLILQDPQHPKGHGQLTMAMGFILAFIALLVVSISVMQQGFIVDLNIPVHHFFRSIHQELIAQIMIFITILGDKRVLIPTSGVIFLAFAFSKQWRAALHWAAAIGICSGTAYIMKALIYSSRPLDIVNPNTSNSFPSGHTAVAVIFFSFLALLIGHNYRRSARVAIYSSSVVIIALIIISRVYLGAHWLTDTIGATLIAICTLLPVTISYRSQAFPKLQLKWVYLFGGLTYLFLYFAVCFTDFKHLEKSYQPVWPSAQIKLNQWWQQEAKHPLYRTNRIGQPIHLINIQWAENLSLIQKQLTNNGWILIPKQTMMNTIGRFSKTSHAKELPIIPAVYQGQTPVLEMVKPTGIDKLYLVLQLWNSRIQFTDAHLPLWVGTINYRLPKHHKFWEYRKYREEYRTLPSAILQLQPVLLSNSWRAIKYPEDMRPKGVLPFEWSAGSLLIKPMKQSQGFEYEIEYIAKVSL